MIKVVAVPDRNQLQVVVTDPVDPTGSREIVSLIEAESDNLKPGWTAAIDLRGVAAKTGFNEIFVQVDTLFRARGAGKIGTLVSSQIVSAQLSRAAKEAQVDSMVRRFTDEAAWRKFVDS